MLTSVNEGSNRTYPGIVLLDFASAQSLRAQPEDYDSNREESPVWEDRRQAYYLLTETMGEKQGHEWLVNMLRTRRMEGIDEFEEGFWTDLLAIHKWFIGIGMPER
jgi:hypothetical protein